MNKNVRTESITPKCLSGQSILAFIILITAVSVANAAWTIEPVLRVGAEKDDNPTLSARTDDKLDDTGYLIDASARFDYRSELTQFHFTPRILSRNYSDHPEELDSDDVFFNSSFSHDTESSTVSFGLGYTRQAIRQAERADANLDVDEPDEIPDDDTGRVRIRGDREKWRFSPRWSHRFSEASSLGLRFDYSDVTYDFDLPPSGQPSQIFLDDYTDARLGVSFNRAFSERTTGIVTASGRRFESVNPDPIDPLLMMTSDDSTGVSLMVGLRHSLSETTVVRALIGVEDVESDVTVVPISGITTKTTTKSDPELVADISLRRRLETIDILAQYRRTVSAGGSGKLRSRDQINLNLSRRLTEKITAGLGARAYQTNGLDDSVSIDERDYVQLRAQFIWHISSSFATEVDYRFTFQQRSDIADSANSNQIILWFVYQPNSVDRRFR